MDAQQGFASQDKSNEAVEIEGCICKVEVSILTHVTHFSTRYRLCNSLHTCTTFSYRHCLERCKQEKLAVQYHDLHHTVKSFSTWKGVLVPYAVTV